MSQSNPSSKKTFKAPLDLLISIIIYVNVMRIIFILFIVSNLCMYVIEWVYRLFTSAQLTS